MKFFFLKLNGDIENSLNLLNYLKYLNCTGNLGHLVKIYKYIFEHNKNCLKSCFKDDVLDYGNWLLKSNLPESNLNTYIRILKDVGTPLNESTNTFIINLSAIYTDVDTSIKYKVSNFNNFDKFNEILIFNEKYKYLEFDEIGGAKKKI